MSRTGNAGHRRRLAWMSAVSGLSMGLGGTAVHAQNASTDVPANQIQEIVVTAQKRSENIQKVPVAVTAVNGATLDKMGIRNIMDLGTASSGVLLEAGNGAVQPSIRGIQGGSVFVGGVTTVAMYVDGVYFSRMPVGVFSLTNIDRVEVLKGPQGTLFGVNSNAGVISIVTKDPAAQPGIKGSISYGNYNIVEGNLYANAALADKLTADIAVSGRSQGDGFGRNLQTGNRINFTDYLTVRSKIRYAPTDITRITLSGMYSKTTSNPQGGVFPGFTTGYFSPPFTAQYPGYFYDQNTDVDQRTRSNLWALSLKVEQDLSFGQLTSTTAYLKEDESPVFDGDTGPRPDLIVVAPAKVKQFTQELQIAGNAGRPVTWVAGLFYYHNLSRYDDLLELSPSGALPFLNPGLLFFSQQKQESYAGYAQVSYQILPRLKLTGGLRYTSDRYEAGGHTEVDISPRLVLPSASGSDKTNRLTYKAAIDYQFTPDILGFFSYTRGVKAGSFNLFPFSPDPLKPEELNAYEVGLKMVLFNRRLRLNLGAFEYDYTNLLVGRIINAQSLLSNAGAARSRGVEAEGEVVLAQGLTGRFSVNYLNAKFTDYPDALVNFRAPDGSLGSTVLPNAAGKIRPDSPEIIATVGLDYSIDTGHGRLDLGVDYRYTDQIYNTVANDSVLPAHGELNARIRFAPVKAFSIELWGKNLTDQRYATLIPGGQTPGWPFIPGPPRTYGATLGFDF